jgi:hypothetical protein
LGSKNLLANAAKILLNGLDVVLKVKLFIKNKQVTLSLRTCLCNYGAKALYELNLALMDGIFAFWECALQNWR